MGDVAPDGCKNGKTPLFVICEDVDQCRMVNTSQGREQEKDARDKRAEDTHLYPWTSSCARESMRRRRV